MAKFNPKIKDLPTSGPWYPVDSELEVPDGRNPDQNAWLTIRLKVRLNFLDGRNPGGLVLRDGNEFFIKDYNKSSYRVANWDSPAINAVKRGFLAGEKIWNYRFVLITPQFYDGLDFESMQGAGWHVRPNVLCLFRLELVETRGHATINTGAHATINLVKLDKTFWESVRDTFSSDFRSHAFLYTSTDVYDSTLGHELGHLLGQDHILGLLGDARCKLNSPRQGEDDCYGRTPSEKADIMGSGNVFQLVNGVTWRNRIALHTDTSPEQWGVTTNVQTTTRKIPLGVMQVAPPTSY